MRPPHPTPRFSRLASLTGAVLFVALGLAPGCKRAAPSPGAAPSASGSAGALASTPCGKYGALVCEKAGSQSPTCQSVNATLELLPPDVCVAALKDVNYSLQKLAAASKACDELVKTLCAAVGPDTQTCKMVTTQTQQFEPERCKSMAQHLPEVIAQLKEMEAANQPLDAALQKAMVEGGAATFGPETAAVQVVEFSDFQCPYCSRAADAVEKLRAKYGDRVRFTFRQFPLPMHQNAKAAAEAALSANAQGKFWEFHDLLFKNQQSLDAAALAGHAKQAGLNVSLFKKALDEHKYAATVEADIKLGQSAHVQGTPTMFINGARVADPTSFEAIAAQIEQAMKAPGHPG